MDAAPRDAAQPQEPGKPRYLEDVRVGERIRTGEFLLTAEFVRDFAAIYDPQPMHLDETAAKRTVFGGLVASGWQTLAITMRLMVEARPLGATPLVGVAVDELRFLRPVRPGDRLYVEAEVLEVRTSRTRPERGTLRLRVETCDREGRPVATQLWTAVLPTCPVESGR